MNEERKYHGHVVAVNAERLGDNLDTDALLGATTLVVGDIADFDELGGSLIIDGAVLRYSTCDDDLGTVTLVDPLPAAAELGDPVYVWDTQRLAVATEYVAQVEIDADDEGDPVEAVIASHLVDDLPDGIRGLVGESVLMEEEDDEWRIVDVLGLDRDAKGTLFYQDAFTVGAPGTQDFSLTFTPIEHSEHVYWNGLYQPQGAVWSRVEQVVTVSDPDDYLAPDDVVTVEYAYLDGTAVVPAEPITSGDNDNFTDALTVSIATPGGAYISPAQFQTGFTMETGEPQPTGYASTRSAWWKYTPASSGNAQIDTTLSSLGHDTELAIYTGSAVDALTKIASDSDSGGSGRSLISSVALTSGVTYHIQVAVWVSAADDGRSLVLRVIGPAT